MKNLKINKNRIKALLGTIILTTNLTACNFTQVNGNNREVYKVEDSLLNNSDLQYLFVNDKLVSINDLRLADKDGKVINNVDGVLVDNKLMKVNNPIEIAFSKDIDSVIIDNTVISASEFNIIDVTTNEVIKDIKGVFVNNQLLSLDGSVIANMGYEVLTNEKFYELVDNKIAECEKKGIAFDKSDVEVLAMQVNINKLLVDNPELVFDILGTDNITDEELMNVMMDGEQLQDTFNSYNCNLFRDTKSTDGFILISDLIFDSAEKEKAKTVEAKVNEIGSYSRTDVDKMNELITAFLTDLYECKLDVYNMESGTEYGLRYVLRPIRDLYGLNECEDKVTLNSQNKQFIKYFVSYAGDEQEYYINGWGTRAYQNTYGILKSGDCKTLVK